LTFSAFIFNIKDGSTISPYKLQTRNEKGGGCPP
jgi:hypothetical protein